MKINGGGNPEHFTTTYSLDHRMLSIIRIYLPRVRK